MSPWLFSCKEDINWVWSHPAYNYQDSNYVVSLPAIVSYRQQSETNINILISNEKTQNILTWSCPKCCYLYTEKSPDYFCFCGKFSNPEYDPFLVIINVLSSKIKGLYKSLANNSFL